MGRGPMPTISRVYCMARAALTRKSLFGTTLFELGLFGASPWGAAADGFDPVGAAFLGEGCAHALQQSAKTKFKDNVPWSLMLAFARVSFAAQGAPTRRCQCLRRTAQSWAPRRCTCSGCLWSALSPQR